jgi:hypothetical protein
MPTSVQCAASDKLKELLHYIIELSTLCNTARVVTAVSTSEPGSDVRILQTIVLSLSDFIQRSASQKAKCHSTNHEIVDFHKTQKFITVFTRAHPWTLS